MLTCRCIFMFLPLNSKVWLSCLLLASWTLLWSTLCLWQRVEHSTVTCLSGCDMGFPYLASQESTWTWLAVSLVCTVSLGCTWTPVPHWHLKRPSVRFSQAGGGPARLLIKAMSCKIEREGGGWQLAPACYTELHLVCGETNLPGLPAPPVTVNGFVYVYTVKTAIW